MGKVDLSITLDKPDRIYRPGEHVTGQVHLDARKAVRCRKLVIALAWRTLGRNDRIETRQLKLRYKVGACEAGARLTYPFEFVIPSLPDGHRMTSFDFGWRIEAKAVVSWSFNARTEARLAVLTWDIDGAGVTHWAGGEPASTAPESRADQFVIILLFLVGMATYFTWSRWPAPDSLSLLFIGVICASLLAVAIAYAYRFQRAESALGNVRFDVEQGPISPSEDVRAAIAFCPTRPVRINNATLELACVEITSMDSGDGGVRRHVDTLCRHSVSLLEDVDLSFGERYEQAFELPVAENELTTMDAGCKQIRWQAELNISMAGYPNLRWMREVVVCRRTD